MVNGLLFLASRSNLLEWLSLNKFLSCFWRCRILKKSPNQRLCKSLKNHTLPVVLSVFVSGAWATHRHQCRLRPVPHRLQRGGEKTSSGSFEIEDGGKSDESFQSPSKDPLKVFWCQCYIFDFKKMRCFFWLLGSFFSPWFWKRMNVCEMCELWRCKALSGKQHWSLWPFF